MSGTRAHRGFGGFRHRRTWWEPPWPAGASMSETRAHRGFGGFRHAARPRAARPSHPGAARSGPEAVATSRAARGIGPDPRPPGVEGLAGIDGEAPHGAGSRPGRCGTSPELTVRRRLAPNRRRRTDGDRAAGRSAAGHCTRARPDRIGPGLRSEASRPVLMGHASVTRSSLSAHGHPPPAGPHPAARRTGPPPTKPHPATPRTGPPTRIWGLYQALKGERRHPKS
jgi:hypothetical protein